jgi:mannan endo-1,4-beta-mannosidase
MPLFISLKQLANHIHPHTKTKNKPKQTGPGTQCDGEDWLSITAMPEVDFATIHVYERHMELRPSPTDQGPNGGDWPNWLFCGFDCFIEWFRVYVRKHIELAKDRFNKPLVLEEFGSTWWKATPEQRAVLFQLVADWVVEEAKAGGAFAGALFWNGACCGGFEGGLG